MVFCNKDFINGINTVKTVTILILIDGFLQFILSEQRWERNECHNPYFNRWFSAITPYRHNSARHRGHNPYFNRWFSAI